MHDPVPFASAPGRSSCSHVVPVGSSCTTDWRVCGLDPPGGLQNHSRLRTPPPPLSHAHGPNQHHAASVSSLNRGNFTPRSNPSPAPTDHSLSGEPAAGAQEPAHAQDNWLLNSNIPLETRCGVHGGRGGRGGAARLRPPGQASAAGVLPVWAWCSGCRRRERGWAIGQKEGIKQPRRPRLACCLPKL